MKAFITGYNGQDGSYLAELLLSKDYEVHGLMRRTSEPLKDFQGDRFRTQDLRKMIRYEGDVAADFMNLARYNFSSWQYFWACSQAPFDGHRTAFQGRVHVMVPFLCPRPHICSVQIFAFSDLLWPDWHIQHQRCAQCTSIAKLPPNAQPAPQPPANTSPCEPQTCHVCKSPDHLPRAS